MSVDADDCELCEYSGGGTSSSGGGTRLSRSSSRRRLRRRRSDTSASSAAPASVVTAGVTKGCARWSPHARPARPIYRHVMPSAEAELTDDEGGRCIWDSSDSEGESRRRDRARRRRERRNAASDDALQGKLVQTVRFIDGK